MADIFTSLGTAIQNRMGTVQYTYNASGTANVTGTLPLYDSLAPQGTQPPYNIYQMPQPYDVRTFGQSGVSVDVVFKTVSNRLYPVQQGYPIYSQMHPLIEDAPLSISGYAQLRCRRQSAFAYRDPDGYWHVGGIYRVDVWQA